MRACVPSGFSGATYDTDIDSLANLVNFAMDRGGGGYSGYKLVGVCPGTPKKGGLMCWAQPKKGGLRCGHSPKKVGS